MSTKKYCRFFLSGLKNECRNFSFCDHKSCVATLRNKISCIVLKETKKFCLQIINVIGEYVDPDFVIHVFQTYERGKDYFSINLYIER